MESYFCFLFWMSAIQQSAVGHVLLMLHVFDLTAVLLLLFPQTLAEGDKTLEMQAPCQALFSNTMF